MYNIKHLGLKTKSSYSFADRDTDRQTESISECILKDLSNDTVYYHDIPTKNEN